MIESLSIFAEYHQHRVRNWLQSYQDLLGTIMPSETDQTSQISTTTTTAPETTTSTSLLMSLIGDFIPYITGDSESDDHDDDDDISDNFVRRQGLAYQSGDGGESKR